MKRIDANVILRYLLDDHAELSRKAGEIIENQDVFGLLFCKLISEGINLNHKGGFLVSMPNSVNPVNPVNPVQTWFRFLVA